MIYRWVAGLKGKLQRKTRIQLHDGSFQSVPKGSPWTIRWDYDDKKKGPHINASFGKGLHAIKYAFKTTIDFHHKIKDMTQTAASHIDVHGAIDNLDSFNRYRGASTRRLLEKWKIEYEVSEEWSRENVIRYKEKGR